MAKKYTAIWSVLSFPLVLLQHCYLLRLKKEATSKIVKRKLYGPFIIKLKFTKNMVRITLHTNHWKLYYWYPKKVKLSTAFLEKNLNWEF